MSVKKKSPLTRGLISGVICTYSIEGLNHLLIYGTKAINGISEIENYLPNNLSRGAILLGIGFGISYTDTTIKENYNAFEKEIEKLEKIVNKLEKGEN